jgi:heterodisulfide reductase subunit A
VVGGGISGIQAALDIADGGYEVVLVEKSPSIGGHMIQLSEVFPTLDCPQCIMTPKMVEISHHPNVRLLTYSEVTDVSGSAGNFKVRIRRKARYVDEDKCTGCDECTKGCPVQVPAEFDRGLITRKAIYRPFAQAVPNVFTIDKQGHSSCRLGCPAGVNVHGYVALIAEGKYKEALEVIRECMPFAGVCGRVCTHPCEQECERGKVDAPVSIRALKRFVADYELQVGREKAAPAPRKWDEKVAVIGSGPAGLACAYDLVREGYPVTVFEAMPETGGLLRYGIPEFRLPQTVLADEIRLVKELGVEIRVNARVANPNELFHQGYKAVFMASGAGLSRGMGIPGEDNPGVLHALGFLEQVNRGEQVELGDRVAVIGGGNAAIDAARTAVRLGAKDVSIVYRRTRKEMPAIESEVEEAEREGVELRLLTTPVEMLVADGRLTGMRCIRMELGEPDESGRRRPVPVPGSEFDVEIDNVVLAVGQAVDEEALPEGLETTGWNTIAIDPVTLETSIEGVFAGGDASAGPADVILAIAAGKERTRRCHTGHCRRQGSCGLHPSLPERRGYEGGQAEDSSKGGRAYRRRGGEGPRRYTCPR